MHAWYSPCMLGTPLTPQLTPSPLHSLHPPLPMPCPPPSPSPAWHPIFRFAEALNTGVRLDLKACKVRMLCVLCAVCILCVLCCVMCVCCVCAVCCVLCAVYAVWIYIYFAGEPFSFFWRVFGERLQPTDPAQPQHSHSTATAQPYHAYTETEHTLNSTEIPSLIELLTHQAFLT